EALRPHVRGGAELRELLEQRGESALRLRDLGGADAAALERPGDQRRHDGGDFRRELVREHGAGGQHVGEQPCGGLRGQGQRTGGGTTPGISARSLSARTGLVVSTSVSRHAVVSASRASGSSNVATRITIRAETRACTLSSWGSAAACSEAVNSSTRSVPS